MKKLTVLTIISALLLCACSTEVSEPVHYTIYSVSWWDESSENKGIYKENIGENVSFGDSKKMDFNHISTEEISNSSAPENKILKIDGKEFDLKLDGSYAASISNSDIGKNKSLGIYDEYKYENDITGSVSAEFSQNKLVFFLHHGSVRREQDGDFTEIQAKEKADSLIAELYGKEALELYTHTKTYVSDGETLKGFSVHYARFVHGYETDESISIDFNRKGDLVSINALRLGFFEDAEKDISKNDIEAAEKTLKETLHETWAFPLPPVIVISSEGQYFLKFTVSSSDPNNSLASFYININ